MNDQEKFWSGDGGNSYTARNRVNWRARIPFWHDIMKFTGARSVFEVGANAGWNLSAIHEASPHRTVMRGREINEVAAHQAQHCGLNVLRGSGIGTLGFELVFTAGVLIHVAPENLQALMNNIIAASTHYVLAIEYESDTDSAQPLTEQMIEYRGQQNLLWKRPYGKLYEAMGLKVLHSGDAVGFDRCQYWLMEKQ